MILHEKTAFGPTKLMIHMGNAGLSHNLSFLRKIRERNLESGIYRGSLRFNIGYSGSQAFN